MHFLPGVCIAFRRKIYGPYIFNGAKERNILVCPLNLYLCAMCASIGNGAWKNRLDKGEKAISFCSLCLSYRLHSMQCAALPLSHAANLFRFHAQGKKRDVKHDEIICTSVQMYNMQSIFYLILSNRIKNRMQHEGITHMNITTGGKFMNGSWEVITNAWKSHCGVHISTYRMNVELSKDPIQMMFLQIMLFTCNCSDYIKGSLELCGCSSTVWSN